MDSSGRGFVAERPNLRGCRDRGPEDIWNTESGLASLSYDKARKPVLKLLQFFTSRLDRVGARNSH